MMKTIICLIIFYNINYVTCQKLKCNDKDADNADVSTRELYLFGSPDREYPTNQNQLKAFCKDNFELRDSIKQYSQQCLTKLSQQVLNLNMYSVNKNNENICKSRKRGSEFVKLSGCGNAAKTETAKCYKKWISELDGITTLDNHKFKIPLLCCSYYQVKFCFTRGYESLPEQCNRGSIDGLERLIDTYALEALRLLCGDYTEDSDKCDKILHLIPKSENKQLSKSHIIPAIKILDSIPE